MTEKQFRVIDGYDTENNPIKMIEDTETTEQYSLENELEANSLCERVNSLADENEQLKQELYQIDKLIEDLGHEEMKRQYEEICGDNDD